MTTFREALDCVLHTEPHQGFCARCFMEVWAYGDDAICATCGGDGWLHPYGEGEPSLRDPACPSCGTSGKVRKPGLAFRAYDRMVACQRDDHGDDECWIDALRQELGEVTADA